MKISIITISYNRVNTIAAAIESVLSQDYPNVEYIVVDGASTDGTQAVIERYADRITHYHSAPDTGMYNALNKAINLCTGDVVGLLHSDDVFYNKQVLTLYARSFAQSNADVVYADGMYVEESSEFRVLSSESRKKSNEESAELNTQNSKLNTKRIYRSSPFRPWYLYFGWIPLHTTIFVKRELFAKYGLYDESYSIASDYEISLRWFSNAAIKKHYIKAWTVKMLLGGKSTSMALQKKKSSEDNRVLQQYRLWGKVTLLFKIVRKIPQYILPRFLFYK